jgi:DNA-binding GntR family transcriptional regulator
MTRSTTFGPVSMRPSPLSQLPVLKDEDLRTSHEVVSAALRRAIVSGALPGGSRLVQTELAAEMGVSTTPIREAFRDLVAEGLLEFDRYRGAIVHEPTIEELREIYDMRLALEPIALRRAAGRITDEQAAEASELIAAMDDTDDVPTFVELNRRFHELLTNLSASPRLIATLRTLRDAAALYVGASLEGDRDLMRSSNREHQQLLDACRVGDADLAEGLIVRHFQATVDSISRRS